MTSHTRVQNVEVGILGGGQLGCMLADAALVLGLEPRIYAEASSPAASLFADRWVEGSTSDEAGLRAFFASLSLIVFENEFLDCDLLERAAQGLSLRFAPRLDAIRQLQDKLGQKELLVKLGLPTAPFEVIRPEQDAARAVAGAFGRFGAGVAFKWSRMGYDGKGVCLAEDTESGRAQALEFCRQSLDRDVPVYAEPRIRFRRELAVIGCRSASGEFAAYPLVVSEQEQGICKRVLGPARAFGVSAATESQAGDSARRLAEATGLEGSFALELFETAEGELCINEIAPRVHNSGHYTQDACGSSQFDNHWRAVLGLELGKTSSAPLFGMLNLLGPEGVSLPLPKRRSDLPFPPLPPELKLHWYAKAEVRPWRKVGHLNATGRDLGDLPALEQALRAYHASWTERLKLLQSQKGKNS